jgi:excisionase family DNA binding protein
MLCIFVARAHQVLSRLTVRSRDAAHLPFANRLDMQMRHLPSLIGAGVGGMSSTREKTAFTRAESHRLPTLVDIQAVSHSFGISMRQIRRFVAQGQIPFVRVGHLIRFDPEELNDWIDARRSGLRYPAQE